MNEKPKAYTAWLIERIDLGYPTYWAGPSKSVEFSDNIDNAVKFRFEEDAQRVLDRIQKSQFIGGAQFAVRDHQWGFTDELDQSLRVCRELVEYWSEGGKFQPEQFGPGTERIWKMALEALNQ